MVRHASELFVGLVALAFMILGVWLGWRLFRNRSSIVEADGQAGELQSISARELEVLRLLAGGKSNKEIARQLDVSPNTVKTHVANLFEKLGARRRTEAILRARELGVIR
jgi:DNA-binding NarL/FixJ family response regulator